MKANRLGVNRIWAAALLAGLAVGVSTAWALHMSVFPDEMQTKTTEPVARRIMLKLPLEQPTFHWEFMSREDFLAGRLVLRITRGEETQEIVVFEKGKFAEGWDALEVGDVERERGEVYFGFESKTKYPTAPGDKLEIELAVKTDLDGIGALHTGILPAGKYVSKGGYTGLTDVTDTSKTEALLRQETGVLTDEQKATLEKLREMYEYKAFLENWETQWPLRITGEKGWLPEDKAAALRRQMEVLKPREAPGQED